MKNEIEKQCNILLEKLSSPYEISNVMNFILEQVEDIPFGNSDYQNKLCIIENELLPHRAYRSAALKIIDRLSALNECYFNLKEKEIEIKKLKRQLDNETDELEKELIQIKIDRIVSNFPYTKKLIKDAIVEVKSLLPFLLAMGKINKEEFENKEKEYFTLKLKIQESIGTIEKYIIEQNNSLPLYNYILKGDD